MYSIFRYSDEASTTSGLNAKHLIQTSSNLHLQMAQVSQIKCLDRLYDLPKSILFTQTLFCFILTPLNDIDFMGTTRYERASKRDIAMCVQNVVR